MSPAPTKIWGVAGASTNAVSVSTRVALARGVTVTRTVYRPGAAYTWVAYAGGRSVSVPRSVAPSPQLIAYGHAAAVSGRPVTRNVSAALARPVVAVHPPRDRAAPFRRGTARVADEVDQ